MQPQNTTLPQGSSELGPNPKLRVLHLLSGLTGGAALSTLELIEALASRGVESSLYGTDRGSPSDAERLAEAVDGRFAQGPLYYWHRRTRKPWWQRPPIFAAQVMRTGALVKSGGAVERACRAFSVDLVHSATAVMPEGAIAARRLGLPHVWHVREMVGRGHPYRLRGDDSGAALKRLLRTGSVVANSKATAVQLAGDRSDAIHVVPNGLRLEPLLLIPPSPVTASSIDFGMVASLTSTWKEHHLFVRAAALVGDEVPEARFVLVGRDSGPGAPASAAKYARHIHGLVEELGLTERFRFAGFVRDAALIMDQLDVLVHPASGESFGRIFVEAAAAARPVIAVRGGAAPEVVADEVSGVLVPPRDVAALACAMVRLARSPEKRAMMGLRGREIAVQSYSIERCADQVLTVYKSAAAQPPAGSWLKAVWEVLK